MKLVIVESPTKVKTVKRYLGKDFDVKASRGHFRDLANSGYHNLGVDLDNNYAPDYEIMAKSKGVVRRLQLAAEQSDEVYLATDPDREGEAIAWHLTQVLHLDVAATPRLEFNEITPKGVADGFAAPRFLDMNLVKSQETRRIIDRIMGYELSNLLQKKIHSLSAGRVQSAVLKIVCDREKEIENFVPEAYYEIYATIRDNNNVYRAKLTKINGEEARITSEEEAKTLIEKIDSSLRVISVEETEKDDYPFPPFTTSTLQQEAFNVLRFSTKKTMEIAQRLYEGAETKKGSQGAITYMRTDSYRLSPLFIVAAKKEIEKILGSEYVGKAYGQKAKANVQDAHEGIRPTNAALYPKIADAEFKDKNQAALYRLIYNRAVASMMKPRRRTISKIKFQSGPYKFYLEGSDVTFLGWQKVYNPYKKEPEKFSHSFAEGNVYPLAKSEIKKETTKPPFRFNEAKLVRTMEELGIGRPSTYAQTIDTLKKRDYMKENKGYLYPTEQGILTAKRLSEYFASLVDSQYTAALETQLDKVATGEQGELALLNEFTDEFYRLLSFADEAMPKEPVKYLDELCPLCGAPLTERRSKTGKFIGCSNYPKCAYTRPLASDKPIKGEGEICPKCGVGHLIKKKSRFGYFLGCDRYPDCDFTRGVGRKYKKYFVSAKKK